MKCFFIVLLVLVSPGCKKSSSPVSSALGYTAFHHPRVVTISGYSGDAMEPFISKDGQYLFFNNRNTDANTDIHFARRTNDSTFLYLGKPKGLNTAFLEGVASLDQNQNFYFTSNRSYSTSLATIYEGTFSADSIENVHLVTGDFVKHLPYWLNMDGEINAAGTRLYVTQDLHSSTGTLISSDIVISEKAGADFNLTPTSSAVLAAVNTTQYLEYAPCISADELELFFTRADVSLSNPTFSILRAARSTSTDPFGSPQILTAIQGNVTEAPTLTLDGKTLYYHHLVNDTFRIYSVSR